MELRHLKTNVEHILETDEETRGDDFALIVKVYKEMKGTLFTSLKFEALMLGHETFGLPSFESITRCRRKIQAERPELRATREVENIRMDEQKKYLEFAEV